MSFERWNKFVDDTKERRKILHDFYKSKQWQQCRENVLKRDNYLCKCGKPATTVHHIIHLNLKNVNDPAITLNENNLISVCDACHFEYHRGEHAGGRKAQEDYPYEFDSNGLLVPKKIDGA